MNSSEEFTTVPPSIIGTKYVESQRGTLHFINEKLVPLIWAEAIRKQKGRSLASVIYMGVGTKVQYKQLDEIDNRAFRQILSHDWWVYIPASLVNAMMANDTYLPPMMQEFVQDGGIVPPLPVVPLSRTIERPLPHAHAAYPAQQQRHVSNDLGYAASMVYSRRNDYDYGDASSTAMSEDTAATTGTTREIESLLNRTGIHDNPGPGARHLVDRRHHSPSVNGYRVNMAASNSYIRETASGPNSMAPISEEQGERGFDLNAGARGVTPEGVESASASTPSNAFAASTQGLGRTPGSNFFGRPGYVDSSVESSIKRQRCGPDNMQRAPPAVFPSFFRGISNHIVQNYAKNGDILAMMCLPAIAASNVEALKDAKVQNQASLNEILGDLWRQASNLFQNVVKDPTSWQARDMTKDAVRDQEQVLPPAKNQVAALVRQGDFPGRVLTQVIEDIVAAKTEDECATEARIQRERDALKRRNQAKDLKIKEHKQQLLQVRESISLVKELESFMKRTEGQLGVLKQLCSCDSREGAQWNSVCKSSLEAFEDLPDSFLNKHYDEGVVKAHKRDVEAQQTNALVLGVQVGGVEADAVSAITDGLYGDGLAKENIPGDWDASTSGTAAVIQHRKLSNMKSAAKFMATFPVTRAPSAPMPAAAASASAMPNLQAGVMDSKPPALTAAAAPFKSQPVPPAAATKTNFVPVPMPAVASPVGVGPDMLDLKQPAAPTMAVPPQVPQVAQSMAKSNEAQERNVFVFGSSNLKQPASLKVSPFDSGCIAMPVPSEGKVPDLKSPPELQATIQTPATNQPFSAPPPVPSASKPFAMAQSPQLEVLEVEEASTIVAHDYGVQEHPDMNNGDSFVQPINKS